MSQPLASEPVELCKSADEYEASMIVALLADHDIQATMTGEFSAGFRAEAPGVVRVHVAHADLPLAKQLLAEAIKHRDSRATDESLEPNAKMTPAWSVDMLLLIILAVEVIGGILLIYLG